MTFSADSVEKFFTNSLLPLLMLIGLKAAGALGLWLVGRWLLRLALRGLDRTLSARGIEATLRRYVYSVLSVLLTATLIIAVFGYLGVQVATFAALLAGAGLAIGTAWGDLLKNFAAGIFLLMMRPYKVGDDVTAGGVRGVIEEVGVFTTIINVGDSTVRAFVGNAKVLAENIQNHSAYHPHSRAELKIQLGHGADPGRLMAAIAEGLPKIPDVLPTPAPEVAIAELNAFGPLLVMRLAALAADAGAVQNAAFRFARGLLTPADLPLPPNQLEAAARPATSPNAGG
ncbi:MAG: mechanosensitive ion channel family protein [Polyangiaceae bacterium]|jgi:small conductance mechanosensitive channel|nr:mechanosensitive ion channel family protein [Polyangiaceae bacterium]